MENFRKYSSEVELTAASSNKAKKDHRICLWQKIMFRLAIYASIISELVYFKPVLSDVIMYFGWACMAVFLGLFCARRRFDFFWTGQYPERRVYWGLFGLTTLSIFWPHNNHSAVGIILFCVLAVVDICELIIYRKYRNVKAESDDQAPDEEPALTEETSDLSEND